MNKFTNNFISILTTKIFKLILGLLISILIARNLGPTGQGQYALVLLIPTTLYIFGNLGIGQSSIYYLNKENQNKNSVIFTTLISSLIISLILIVFGGIIVLFFKNSFFTNINSNILILSLFILPLYFQVNLMGNILIALNEIKYFNLYSIYEKLIFLSLIIVLMFYNSLEVFSTLLGFTLSMFIVLFLFLNKLIRKYLINGFKYDIKYLHKGLSYGFKIYLSNIFIFLHYKVDILLINFFLTTYFIGIYAVPVGLIEKVWLISASAGTILYPKISSEKTEFRKNNITQNVFKNILYISIIIALFLFFFSDYIIIEFYSDKYQQSIYPLKILLVGSIAIGAWKILANDLFGRGKAKVIAALAGISTLINITLNVVLIPQYGINGAAWSTSISYTLLLILTIFAYKKLNNILIKNYIFLNKADWILYKNIVKNLILNKLIK